MKAKRVPLLWPCLAVCVLFLVSLGHTDANSQVLLYDNSEPGPITGVAPFSPADVAAQQFLTGDFDNVSSVTLALQQVGTPKGEVAVQIWDDDGSGLPGRAVGTLGSFDLSSLPRTREFLTIEGSIAGLSPNTPYYVILDHSDATIQRNNTYRHGMREAIDGTQGAQKMLVKDAVTEWDFLSDVLIRCCGPPPPGREAANYLQMTVTAAADLLQAGDADQDLDFDQLDLVQVQVAAKYLTGQAATWGEGDWDGAPGGSPGNPPAGDGQFNQFDIIAAQLGAAYLTGPYAAIQSGGQSGDGQTSLVYTPDTGELSVDAPAGVELTSINIDSAAGIFTGVSAQNLNGSFDSDADTNIFKATFGSSFGSVNFGKVAQAGLSEEFVRGDLSVVGSLAGGGDLANVDLIYVPEPSTIGMLVFGMLLGLRCFRRVG